MTEWSAVRSLIHRRTVLVPTQMLYFGTGARGEPLYFIADTLGCAAGEDLESAVLSCILELLERDAIAVWWYNRLRCPPVRPELLNNATARPWVRHLRGMNRAFSVLDITTDLNFPVSVAISYDSSGSRVAIGAGCHLDPALAVGKALRELCQTSRSIGCIEPRSFATGSMARAFLQWSVAVNVNHEPHLLPDAGAPARPTPPQVERPILSNCLERLARLGYDPMAIALTRPEINWPATRVICAGLCHPFHRFGLQRLFEAPVRMGLFEKPLTESKMNPVPFNL